MQGECATPCAIPQAKGVGLNAVALTFLVFGLAGTALLAGCRESTARVACERVRGDLEDATSYWSCPSERDVAALQERYDFEECRLIEGMDADANDRDRAYECRRA